MRHRLLARALVLLAAAPAAGFAQEATLRTSCAPGAAPSAAAGAAPDLAGLWDFYLDAGGIPSFGLLSVGRMDGRYGGTLTPVRTAPVLVRSLALTGPNVRLVVGSPEGDVIFDGTLSAAGDRMCGVVAYHGGQLFPMVAQKRRQAGPADRR